MGKDFIKGAIKHKGALHRELGVPAGQTIPKAKIAAAAKKGGKLGARARFAETLARLRPHKKPASLRDRLSSMRANGAFTR